MRSPSRLRRWLIVTVIASGWLAATPTGAALLMQPLQRPYLKGQSIDSPAVIVVLSANASGPAFAGGQTELNGAAWRRLWRGVQLSRQAGPATPLLYSGRSTSFGAGVATETDMARASALAWGIPTAQFWTDDRSGNTYESAVNVRAMLADRHVTGPIVLVTSAWHLRRAVAAFERQGIRVIPVACDARAMSRPSFRGLLPAADSFADSSVAIREWLALAVYKLRGRI